jgi:hypothetical protein
MTFQVEQSISPEEGLSRARKPNGRLNRVLPATRAEKGRVNQLPETKTIIQNNSPGYSGAQEKRK